MTKTPKVALLIESETGNGKGVLRGIAKYAALHGPWNLYRKPFFYRAFQHTNPLQEIKDWKPDGILIRESHFLEEIGKMMLPTVLCTNLPDMKSYLNWPSIVADDLMFGKMGAEYFLGLGFKNFAYCGLQGYLWSEMRGQEFANVLAESGYIASIYEPSPKHREQSEQPFLSKWLKSLMKPVGIFTPTDDRALEVIEACKSVNLKIPQEVAILGIDNAEFCCTLSNPQLSSIALSIERAGYEAAEMLDKLMQGEKMQNQMIILQPLYVVTRQSTNILAIEDTDVARAIRFIRNNSNKLIQVSDVVNETTVSQRVLLRKFKKLTGNTINDEILHSRIDYICRMLLETKLSISQIILQVGYSDINHISRCFKKIRGMTPLAYRKKYGTLL